MTKDVIVGKAYVVGDSIDTDQIIPAQHLVYSLTDPEERKFLGRYAMSAIPREGQGLPSGNTPMTPADAYTSIYTIVIAGSNFGCGSSREMAPVALQEAGIEVVVAQSYARIFYRNSVDGGFLLPLESQERLVTLVRTGDDLEISVPYSKLMNKTTGDVFLLKPLGDVADILKAGNVFEYARQAGFIE